MSLSSMSSFFSGVSILQLLMKSLKKIRPFRLHTRLICWILVVQWIQQSTLEKNEHINDEILWSGRALLFNSMSTKMLGGVRWQPCLDLYDHGRKLTIIVVKDVFCFSDFWRKGSFSYLLIFLLALIVHTFSLLPHGAQSGSFLDTLQMDNRS